MIRSASSRPQWECGAWFATCYVHPVENCVRPLLGDTTDQSVLDAEAA